MQFNKNTMSFTHYRWESKDDSDAVIYEGEPTRRQFDPFNGDQVLFMINYYGSLCDGFSLKDARTAEKKLAYSLPLEMKSEISVLKWLQDTMQDEISPAVGK